MARKTATKRHRKGSMKRMNGGMTTGEHGIAVYGNTDQQMAIGNGSNVIRINDPNAVIPTQGDMQGGRKLKRGRKHGGGLFDFLNPTPATADEAAKAAEAAEAADAAAAATAAEAAAAAEAAEAATAAAAATAAEAAAAGEGDKTGLYGQGLYGGKKKRKGLFAIPKMLLDMTPLRSERKSAKKHRKSSKKGKTAKRRAHKRR